MKILDCRAERQMIVSGLERAMLLLKENNHFLPIFVHTFQSELPEHKVAIFATESIKTISVSRTTRIPYPFDPGHIIIGIPNSETNWYAYLTGRLEILKAV